MAELRVEHLTKCYATGAVVDRVSFSIPDKEWLVLAGPSGCGKTTLLRLIAGLETPTAGSIRFDNQEVTRWPPFKRRVAMAFQQPVLIPHKTVRANWQFALSAERLPNVECKKRIESVAYELEMFGLLDRYPRELSGGEYQRAALGRTLVRNPTVFLFDEPFSQLDLPLRTRLRHLLRANQQLKPTTTIYVTHDQSEVMSLAQTAAIMIHGRLVQIGPPHQLYEQPCSRQVAQFLGDPPMNLFPARLRFDAGKWYLECRNAAWALEGKLVAHANSEPSPSHPRPDVPIAVDVGIRPEYCSWFGPTTAVSRPESISLTATLRRSWRQGTNLWGEVWCDNLQQILHVRLAPEADESSNRCGWITLSVDRLHLFDAASGRRLETVLRVESAGPD